MSLLDIKGMKSEIGLVDFKVNRNIVPVQLVLQQLVLTNGNYQKSMGQNQWLF